MSNDFERSIVVCINRYFTEHRIKGYAYRLKQSRFSTQYVDIIVDSPDQSYYLAIECKSLLGTRLSFSSNFHKDKYNVHQIDNISGFLKYTGRKGYLAVEFRSPNVKNEAYLIPWETLIKYYDTQLSIQKSEIENCIQLKRIPDGYYIESL